MNKRVLVVLLLLLLAGPFVATPDSKAGTSGPPRITALSIDRSPLSGGAEVAVDGSGFTDGTQVTIGDAVAADVEVESPTRLRFTVPAVAYAGGRTLTVRTPAGAAQTKFHILPPRLSDLPNGYITSVGGGIPYLGDGELATASSVGLSPSGIAVDASGNVFVSDYFNHRVRRVDATTGEITTYAGTGTNGFSGDGGPAITAELNNPQGLAIDTDGALLIADWYNGRVRRVDPVTQRIDSLEIESPIVPVDLAVASDGSLFVSSYFYSDYPDGRLFRVDRQAGNEELLYGGKFDFFNQIGLASDEQGRILITLGQLEQLIRYDVETGSAEILVSDIDDVLAFDTDVVSDGPDHCIISNPSNGTVDRVEYATGTSIRIAGTGEHGSTGDGGAAVDAQLAHPTTLATDGGGNLLIVDLLNARVRRVDRDGIIHTMAGSGRFVSEETSGPATSASLGAEFVTVDKAGNVYCSVSNRVMRIDAVSGVLSVVAGTGDEGFDGDGGPASAALLSRPAGLAIDTDSNVYVSDTGNRRVRHIDAQTGVISTVAGGVSRPAATSDIPFALFAPKGLAFDGRNHLYIVDASTPARLMSLNVKSGRLKAVASFPREQYSPGHIAIGSSGTIVVSGYSQIWRVDPKTGSMKVVAGIEDTQGSFGDGGLARNAQVSACGLVYTERGNLLLAHRYFPFPFGGEPSNALRVILKKRKTIHFISGDHFGEFFGDGGPLEAAHFRPYGLASDGDGNLYIADGGNGRIRVVRSILKSL